LSHDKIEVPQDIEVPATSLFAKLPMLGGILAVVGLGSVLANLGGDNKARAMFSYLFAFEVMLSLALGALGWVLIDHLTRAGWAVVVRRLGETVLPTLPVLLLLWIPIGTAGFHILYPWTHESDPILESKQWYLNGGFFYLRAAIYWVAWIALGGYLYRTSVKADSAGLEQRDGLTRKLWGISAPGVLIWALTLSFAAFDWLMSLQPHWYSTIFGVYYFAGAILSFYAFLTLITMALQKAGALKTAVTTEHFHDFGKYMFGFTIFWAYIAFSQFMLIWYANIPEETVFFLHRVSGGWGAISYALPVAHFFVPFLYLLSRHVKRSRVALAWAAVWMLAMQVMDIYWLVLPNFKAGEGEPVLSVSWMDVMALVGMAGAFLGAFGFFLKKAKVIAVNDPRLPESLAHENY
jgi:hypothetical protein